METVPADLVTRLAELDSQLASERASFEAKSQRCLQLLLQKDSEIAAVQKQRDSLSVDLSHQRCLVTDLQSQLDLALDKIAEMQQVEASSRSLRDRLLRQEDMNRQAKETVLALERKIAALESAKVEHAAKSRRAASCQADLPNQELNEARERIRGLEEAKMKLEKRSLQHAEIARLNDELIAQKMLTLRLQADLDKATSAPIGQKKEGSASTSVRKSVGTQAEKAATMSAGIMTAPVTIADPLAEPVITNFRNQMSDKSAQTESKDEVLELKTLQVQNRILLDTLEGMQRAAPAAIMANAPRPSEADVEAQEVVQLCGKLLASESLRVASEHAYEKLSTAVATVNVKKDKSVLDVQLQTPFNFQTMENLKAALSDYVSKNHELEQLRLAVPSMLSDAHLQSLKDVQSFESHLLAYIKDLARNQHTASLLAEAVTVKIANKIIVTELSNLKMRSALLDREIGHLAKNRSAELDLLVKELDRAAMQRCTALENRVAEVERDFAKVEKEIEQRVENGVREKVEKTLEEYREAVTLVESMGRKQYALEQELSESREQLEILTTMQSVVDSSASASSASSTSQEKEKDKDRDLIRQLQKDLATYITKYRACERELAKMYGVNKNTSQSIVLPSPIRGSSRSDANDSRYGSLAEIGRLNAENAGLKKKISELRAVLPNLESARRDVDGIKREYASYKRESLEKIKMLQDALESVQHQQQQQQQQKETKRAQDEKRLSATASPPRPTARTLVFERVTRSTQTKPIASSSSAVSSGTNTSVRSSSANLSLERSRLATSTAERSADRSSLDLIAQLRVRVEHLEKELADERARSSRAAAMNAAKAESLEQQTQSSLPQAHEQASVPKKPSTAAVEKGVSPMKPSVTSPVKAERERLEMERQSQEAQRISAENADLKLKLDKYHAKLKKLDKQVSDKERSIVELEKQLVAEKEREREPKVVVKEKEKIVQDKALLDKVQLLKSQIDTLQNEKALLDAKVKKLSVDCTRKDGLVAVCRPFRGMYEHLAKSVVGAQCERMRALLAKHRAKRVKKSGKLGKTKEKDVSGTASATVSDNVRAVGMSMLQLTKGELDALFASDDETGAADPEDVEIQGFDAMLADSSVTVHDKEHEDWVEELERALKGGKEKGGDVEAVVRQCIEERVRLEKKCA